MHPIAWKVRSWAQRLALTMVCGLALTTSAYAQGGWPGFSFPPFSPTSASSPAAQQQLPVGTVLTVPLWDFGPIVAQNVIRQNNVNLLQVTQTAVGDMNTQVATISIRQANSLQPAKICWLPIGSLQWIKQANKNSTIIEQGAIGFGNTQVAQVEVHQDNDAVVPKGTRFLLCPLWAVPAVQALNQKNVNVVHVSQLAVGDNNSQVALMSVDQNNASKLKVPGNAVGALVQLNLNLNIVTQLAVGNNNTQVATVSVGQDNKI